MQHAKKNGVRAYLPRYLNRSYSTGDDNHSSHSVVGVNFVSVTGVIPIPKITGQAQNP